MTDFHRGSAWQAFAKAMRKQMQPTVDAGSAVCIDCGQPIMPWQKWEVGHRLPRRTHPQYQYAAWNVGPSHNDRTARCNQRAGGKLGNKIARENRARRKGMISL
ncbi:hypothetical protein [Agrococcus jejuensis]|uniref:hypothetical protein n=1 Tax=Agrococcus jejuensis TaxID=399736 RepID=UPI0011A9374E|nr:hypothetical protein [Agrococcus jejuensis]